MICTGVGGKTAEDPELTPSHRHAKITMAYRATISENDLNTGRKYSPQTKIQGGATMSWVGGEKMQWSLDPHPQHHDSQAGGISQGLPKEQGV